MHQRPARGSHLSDINRNWDRRDVSLLSSLNLYSTRLSSPPPSAFAGRRGCRDRSGWTADQAAELQTAFSRLSVRRGGADAGNRLGLSIAKAGCQRNPDVSHTAIHIDRLHLASSGRCRCSSTTTAPRASATLLKGGHSPGEELNRDSGQHAARTILSPPGHAR